MVVPPRHSDMAIHECVLKVLLSPHAALTQPSDVYQGTNTVNYLNYLTSLVDPAAKAAFRSLAFSSFAYLV